MRIDDMYDQGAEGAGGGAFEETWDEQKPNDTDKPSSSHYCFHHETISNEVTVPCVTCIRNTFTCISSGAGAGETSTQVEKYEKKIEEKLKRNLNFIIFQREIQPFQLSTIAASWRSSASDHGGFYLQWRQV